MSTLRIVEFTPALAPEFRAINLEWISAMYSVEPTDREVLDHPVERIIEPGGAILFVADDDMGIIGTCALQRTGAAQFELTKMGVYARARGRQAGAMLLQATIDRGYAMGAELLYLLTNRKSAAAIHLYELGGFRHDADIMARFGARYARCDAAMRHHRAD